MQLTELGMLLEFDRICRKNKINYVLFDGSLLGTARYQGYIPWDDDANIAMLWEDYDKFKKHGKELNPDIFFRITIQTPSTDGDMANYGGQIASISGSVRNI